MQLEAVTAELRPRSDWEAVDLGIALVRRDFRRVLGFWWAAMLPMLVPALLVFHRQPLWALILAWWWTPVASRLVLFYISRHLFGERPGWKAVMREFPGAVTRRFLFRMFAARLSPFRPLSMAVEDLEGLRGAECTRRVRLLLQRGDSTLSSVAVWRAGLMAVLSFALFQSIVMFLPSADAGAWKDFMEEWQAGGWMDPPLLVKIAAVASVMVSMSLTDLFATGAGFGIYVNHRTWVEGWDVEIALRRLGARLAKLSAVMVAIALALGAAPRASAAAPAPDEIIREIKKQPEFEIEKIQVPYPDPPRPPRREGTMVEWLIQIVGLLVAVAAVGLLIHLVWKARHLFRPRRLGESGKKSTAARVVMGMHVTPESLPKDVPSVVMELWLAGRRQEALSLLYRGAISCLIEISSVTIEESDTESDCLRRVSSESPPHASWFGGLTGVWMQLAYARREPEDAEIRALCSGWPFGAERGRL